MSNKIVMAVAELEDGREHIHTKNNKPIKYNLNDKDDLETLDFYYRLYIKEKSMCYSKDLTRMHTTEGSPKSTRVLVKNMRYEPYDENLHIPYRTFAVMFDPKKGEPSLSQIKKANESIQDHIDRERK